MFFSHFFCDAHRDACSERGLPHFFAKAQRNARKESAWFVEVIPLTKWLKKAPPSLKRPNSQVCRDFFTCGEGVGFLLLFVAKDGILAQTVTVF